MNAGRRPDRRLVLTVALPLAALCASLCLAPQAALADDVAKARELFKQCQEMLDAGEPCKAVKICRAGLEAASLEPLKKLEREAGEKCRATKPRTKPTKDKDGDGFADGEDRCPREPEDEDGFQDDDGCPELDNDEDKIADADDRCPNEAEDLDEFEDDDGCPDLDHDKDGVPDDKDRCIGELEDEDGFEDTDGCIDPDNDGDGLADTDDQCPMQAEDEDGFEDDDGCADLDHDGDQIVDGVDRCPQESEDFNGFQDADGCPDGGAGPSVWGWVAGGTGLALLAAGAGLTGVGFGLRSEVEDWGNGTGLAPTTQREAADQAATSDALVISGLALLGVGAAATVAGGVILGLTWTSADSDTGAGLDPLLSGFHVGAGADGSPELRLGLGGRF